MRRIMIVLTASAALSACAAGGQTRYGAELERLQQSCHARGGVLVPGPRVSSANPGANFSCQIHGGASRIR